jgi:hypothetical protein
MNYLKLLMTISSIQNLLSEIDDFGLVKFWLYVVSRSKFRNSLPNVALNFFRIFHMVKYEIWLLGRYSFLNI